MAGAPSNTGNANPLTTDDVLREEAVAIFGADAAKNVAGSKTRAELYQALNKLNVTALCLSGGGIRSAAFGLGVMQALAVHPRLAKQSDAARAGRPGAEARPAGHETAFAKDAQATPEQCLLGKFHYVSTVSGGGYIGSWLSVGIARSSFGEMWKALVERKPTADDEAPQIAWLRTYSNYLTPKLGLTSADTWTAVALYARNLLLNWLIFAPVLCTALIGIKLIGAANFWLADVGWLGVACFLTVAAVLYLWALRFELLHRPTRPLRGAAAQSETAAQEPADHRSKAVRRNDERLQASGRGADQPQFVCYCLIPAALAACAFVLAFWPDVTDPILSWPLWQLVSAGAGLGFLLYAVAWLIALPWPKLSRERGVRYWAKDFLHWIIAGAVYGAFIGLGIYLFANYDLRFLIGGIPVGDDTKDVLLLFIYGVPWVITAQLTAEMIFVGSTSWQIDSDADREWFGRSTGWFAAVAIAWLAVAFLVLIGADLVYLLYSKVDSYVGKTAGGVVGLATGIVTAILGKSSASPARDGEGGTSWTGVALAITTPLFLIALVIGFSALLDDLLLGHRFLRSPLIGAAEGSAPDTFNSFDDLKWLVIGFMTAAAVTAYASRTVNVNRFSLHALYRNRIIRAFLGATNPKRNPDSFTGFDEGDNYSMTGLWPERPGPKRLFHVINIALNVVSSQRLAWQERKAESFTVSPYHAGSAYKAFRPSSEYGGGISTGTAVAISGAAASPNMGYHSSPMVTLLLALFNVRLGWWLGNPGKEGDKTYTKEGPETALRALFDEVLGQTTDQSAYVYLSDGGHFENLGLYEMVRRRCRFIVVSDAGCDKKFQFEDLGNAIRKVWIDLGISITFKGLNDLRYRAERDRKYDNDMPPFYAVGTIDYPAADGPGSEPGTILYIKPCFHANRILNVGVRNYALLNADFPHESTADQFFSESQFESYRALGFEMTDSIFSQALTSSHLPLSAGIDQVFKGLQIAEGP